MRRSQNEQAKSTLKTRWTLPGPTSTPTAMRSLIGTMAMRQRSIAIRHGPRGATHPRLRNCYELAARAMIYEEDAPKWRLVHGKLYGKIGHAWIMLSDQLLYDPTDHEYICDPEVLAYFHPERLYSQHEACTQINASGHYGPWHETPLELS
jgi:hypothetical protein